MNEKQLCKWCRLPIEMMCRLNTLFCSEACAEAYEIYLDLDNTDPIA